MDYKIHKMCRVCLEEGALTSIYSTEFAMMPSTMMMMCAKIRVYETDGLPAVICNNCIYRLGVAYHFKQECENSDIRLRQYLGIHDRGYGICDAETNTDPYEEQLKIRAYVDDEKDDGTDDDEKYKKSKHRKSRYQRKAPEEHKKRGPKPLPKIPQTCFDCNKTFKCAAQLQMHIRTHTGEKPFICNFCNRHFAQKYNLQIHERTHTGERPFQCEICSKQFSALGNFQAHQKIHTGVRDQICPVCNKAFFSSGDLSKHMIIHTGIKNHHCDICGKSFSRNRDMVAHKKKIHLNEQSSENFKCPECHKVFATSSSLSVHFRSHGNSSLPLSQHEHHLHSHSIHAHQLQSVSVTTASMSVHSNLASSHQPIAPTAIGGSLGCPPGPPPPSVTPMGPPISMTMPPTGPLSHMLSAPPSQSTISMMHATQRLHPY